MQNAPEISQANINRYPCPQCGSQLVFSPQTGQLSCPSCNFSQAVERDNRIVEERDFYQFLQKGGENLQPLAREAMQVGCQSCGATVVFTPPETARQCDFCGAKIVAQPKSADPLIAPESVLPFSVDNRAAKEAFQKWLGSLWFAPSALKSMATAQKMSSIYIPYWTYDADTQTFYNGERGEHYYEREYYWDTDSNGNQVQKERQNRKTRWYGASGQVGRHFDDVAVPATTSVLPDYLEKFNWNFGELVPYEPAYLSGHKAQTYQVALDQGFERCKEIMKRTIANDVESDIGGDEQRIHQLSTQYGNITFKHTLLPIYAGAFQFQNKTFQIVVNGRTGEVQGERPYSYFKIGCFALAIIGFILVIVLFCAVLGRS